MKNVTCIVLSLSAIAFPDLVNGQGFRSSRGPGSAGSGTLERAGLKVGMQMPSIKIHDDRGKEFDTASLKGSYSVVTFGCLT